MTKLKERLVLLRASADALDEAARDFCSDIEAAEWEESRVTRDESGKFSSGAGLTTTNPIAREMSQESRLEKMRLHAIGQMTAAVESIDTKIKEAADQFSRSIGRKDDPVLEGGSHLVDSVKAMVKSAKKGSVEATRLATARASVAVAAAQAPLIRKAFIDQLKRAKDGSGVVKTVRAAATAIEVAARAKVAADHVKEHSKDLAAGGVAAAVAIGLGVMASKKFGKKAPGISNQPPSPRHNIRNQPPSPRHTPRHILRPDSSPNSPTIKRLPDSPRGGSLTRVDDLVYSKQSIHSKPTKSKKGGLPRAAKIATVGAAVGIGVVGAKLSSDKKAREKAAAERKALAEEMAKRVDAAKAVQ